MGAPVIPVIWWRNRPEIEPFEQWDSGMLRRLFNGDSWATGYEFEDFDSLLEWTPDGVAIVVVSARHHVNDVVELNNYLSQLDGVLLILLGDEEAVFPWREVQHPKIRFWVMMPHPVKHADMQPWAYFFGTGYRVDTPDVLRAAEVDKEIDWCFAGQATHARRLQTVDGLRKTIARSAGELLPTKSFASGLERADYLRLMKRTRIAPCPSGPATADSMRLYEALEAGCLPIVDIGPEGSPAGYWEMVYGRDHPLIQTYDWTTIGGVIESELIPMRYPLNANYVGAWWEQHKRGMAKRLILDLLVLGAPLPAQNDFDKLTVIITASPIPADATEPGETLLNTMDSISRSMGPGACGHVQFIVAFDGVREEQKHMAEAYHAMVQRFIRHARENWFDVLPVVSKTHRHQAGMVKLALKRVDTPLILFVEHDTPFSAEPGEDIGWESCIELVDYGAIDILRFAHEAQIHPEHERLMLDHRTEKMLGVPVRRTTQFSARPHLARTAYYRQLMERFFPDTANCFVEDKAHGIAQHDTTMRHSIAIYHPEGSIRRTLHSDGRAGGPKFDGEQRFQ